MILSLLNSANNLATNYALLFISYPVQVIGRNVRFLFVVMVGAFFSRVKKTHTNLRLSKHKIITVILSIIVYNHTLAQLQYLAIAIVFTGMFYELYEEIMHEKSEDESSQSAKVEESATDRSDSPTRTKEE